MRRLTFLAVVLALSIAAAGCGEVSTFADAQMGDAQSVDGAVSGPDANPTGVVNVTVLSQAGDGAPVQGATVVFINPDGAVVERVLSDADGKASAVVLLGASVTVIRLNPDGANITTTLDVAPGDDLVFGREGAPLQPLSGQTMTINMTPYPGAIAHYPNFPCGYFNGGLSAEVPTTTVTLYDCPSALADFTIVAVDAAGNGFAVAHADDQPLGQGGTVVVPNTWVPFPELNASYTNVPAGMSYIYVRHNSYTPNDHNNYWGSSADVQVTGAAGTSRFRVAADIGDTRLVSQLSRDGFESQSIMAKPSGTSYGLDVGANLLPWVTAPAIDGATRRLAWVTEGSATYDGIYVNFYWQRPPAQEGGSSTYYSWRVVSPPGVTSLSLPELPPEVGALDLVAGDQAYGNVVLVDVGQYPGYAAFRPRADVEASEIFSASYYYSRFEDLRLSGGSDQQGLAGAGRRQ